MAKFIAFILSLTLAKLVLSRTLWEPSLPEISAPSEDIPIQLEENEKRVQISSLKGTLTSRRLTQLENVTELRIIRNKIRHIESGALCPSKQLKILEIDFSGNRNPPVLTKSMFENCNLDELFLKFDYNNPSKIDKTALEEQKSLKVLAIDSLRVTHLEKDFLILGKNLTTLVLSNIHVETIAANVFVDFGDLEEVAIVHNVELERIPDGLFSKCSKLKRLNLKDNALLSLSWNEFEGLSSLEELNLADNRISSFDADRIRKNMPKLKILSMEMNPLECEQEKQFLTTLTNKFERGIKINSNTNNLMCPS